MNTRLMFAAAALVMATPLLVPGAASAAPRLSPDLQKQAIAVRAVACLAKAAGIHDDRVSAPQEIAARIVPLCEADFAREETAFGAGLSQSGVAQYRAIMAKDRATLAAAVVMDERGHRQTHRRIAQLD